MALPRLDLSARADLLSLATALEAIRRFLALHGVAPEAAFKVELAIDELVNNVIDHAALQGAPGEISVAVTLPPGRIDVDFSDDARLFDPFGQPAPDTQADLDERGPRGLGIHLVRALMTESRYSVEDERNHIRLGLALDDPS